MAISVTGKRRETLVGFLRKIADAVENNGGSCNLQSDDGRVICSLVGEAIEYAMVGITDKGERVVFQDGYTSRTHCFVSATGAATAISSNNGIGIIGDNEYKIVRLVVEDNKGNTIFHQSRELWVTPKGKE